MGSNVNSPLPFNFIYMKTDNRTKSQNDAYFLFQTWVADEMRDRGITLDKLVSVIKPLPTKDSLHVIFKGILEKMYGKTSTTWMTREEMNDCLDVYLDALSECDIDLEFPDREKQTLLQFYSSLQ